jgi:hypothetical protein
LLREITAVPVGYVARWFPELVQRFWIREKYLSPTGIWTPDRPACSLVTN